MVAGGYWGGAVGCWLLDLLFNGAADGAASPPSRTWLVGPLGPCRREFAAIQALCVFAFPSAPFNSIHHRAAPGGGGGGLRAGLCGEGCCFIPLALQRCCSGCSCSAGAGDLGSAVQRSLALPVGVGPCCAGTGHARCRRNPWAHRLMDGMSLGDREGTGSLGHCRAPEGCWSSLAAEETKSP